MIKYEIFNSKNLKKIGYLIVAIAVLLIIQEIYYYFNSISSNIVNNDGGLMGNLYRYKQDSLDQGYLSLLLLMLGIGLVKQNMLGWLLPQVFLLIGNIPFFVFIPYEDFDEIKILLLVGLIVTFLNIYVILLFRKVKLISFFKIKTYNLKYYYPLIIILAITYWIFEQYGNLIIE